MPPGSRAAAPFDKLGMSGSKVEESPGSAKRGWRVTPAGRNPRESATESRPLTRSSRACRGAAGSKGERVRQERTALPATAAARQTPPGARPNRGGGPVRVRKDKAGGSVSDPDRPGWSLERRGDASPRGMAAGARRVPQGIRAASQNPAYRLPGISFHGCQSDFELDGMPLAQTSRVVAVIAWICWSVSISQRCSPSRPSAVSRPVM